MPKKEKLQNSKLDKYNLAKKIYICKYLDGDSVAGKDLRKRRRLNKDQVTPETVALSDERYLESFVDGEISKREYFLFHNLPWPRASKEPQLLSLSQRKFLI